MNPVDNPIAHPMAARSNVGPGRTTAPSAGLGRRLAALFLDWCLFGTFSILLQPVLIIYYLIGMSLHDGTGAAVQPAHDIALLFVLLVIALLFPFAWFVFFHASNRHATPGKMLLGLRVVDRDGRGLDLARSLRRGVAGVVTLASGGLGYLALVLLPDRRALHDLLGNTRVVRMSPDERAARVSGGFSPGMAALLAFASGAFLLMGVLPLMLFWGS